MDEKTTLTLFLSAIIIMMLLFSQAASSAANDAGNSIFIRADGSIAPSDAPIERNGNAYILTGDIYNKTIVVEKDDVIIDGNSHVIQGFNIPFSTGIDLTARTRVMVKNVRVLGFYFGFSLNYSQYNVIWGNTISSCPYIMSAVESKGNKIYNNNFLSAPIRVYGGANIWDGGYPSGGNFWANIRGEDLYSGELQNITGSDGICDQIYEIDEDNFDSYPLMGFFSSFKAEKQGETYPIYVISDSKVSSVSYDPSTPLISLHISGEAETSRFCRMLIPHALLEEPYMVSINGQEPIYVGCLHSNGTHSWIYFRYVSQEDVAQVQIIPEFSPALTLCSLAVLTLLLIIYRRKCVKIELKGVK